MREGQYDPALARQLLLANPDGLWVLDDEGITTYANDNMARILGRDLDAMIGMPVFDVLDEQGRQRLRRPPRRSWSRAASPATTSTPTSCVPTGRRSGAWSATSRCTTTTGSGPAGCTGSRRTPSARSCWTPSPLASSSSPPPSGSPTSAAGTGTSSNGTVTWSDEMYRIVGVEPGTPVTPESYRELIHPDDRGGADESSVGRRRRVLLRPPARHVRRRDPLGARTGRHRARTRRGPSSG